MCPVNKYHIKLIITSSRFISLSNENFQSVLPFATLWAKLDPHTPSRHSYDILTNSFHSNFVNRYHR